MPAYAENVIQMHGLKSPVFHMPGAPSGTAKVQNVRKKARLDVKKASTANPPKLAPDAPSAQSRETHLAQPRQSAPEILPNAISRPTLHLTIPVAMANTQTSATTTAKQCNKNS